MRRPLRHALSILRAAGIEVDHVRQAGKHTEIVLEDGNLYRLPRGNRPSRRFERGLRSYIRKLLRSEARP